MDCGDTDTAITAVVQPLGGSLVYEWSSPSGEILDGGNTLTAMVNANNVSDVFYFTITNQKQPLHGCGFHHCFCTRELRAGDAPHLYLVFWTAIMIRWF